MDWINKRRVMLTSVEREEYERVWCHYGGNDQELAQFQRYVPATRTVFVQSLVEEAFWVPCQRCEMPVNKKNDKEKEKKNPTNRPGPTSPYGGASRAR
jgi:hypothetical protein